MSLKLYDLIKLYTPQNEFYLPTDKKTRTLVRENTLLRTDTEGSPIYVLNPILIERW